jgi:hypothetical protein
MSDLTKFQKRTIFFTSLGFLLSIIIIIILIFALKTSERKLTDLGNIMEEMSNSRIQYDMKIKQSIEAVTDAEITDDVNVGIDLVVESSIPFQAEIPVNEDMIIPINLGVNQVVYVDTLISIVGDVNINVDDTIPLDQKIKAAGMNVKAKADIPLKQQLTVNFDEQIRMQSYIPIDMKIRDSMALGLEMKIPVNLMVPVKIPLHTTARISFFETLPFKATIPIELDVPVDIPLNETAMGDYLKKVAKGMKELTKP